GSVDVLRFFAHLSVGDASSLFNHQNFIYLFDLIGLRLAIGPAHFQILNFCRRSQPEMNSQVRLGIVAAPARYFTAPPPPIHREENSCASGVTRALPRDIADEPQRQPVTGFIAAVIAQ